MKLKFSWWWIPTGIGILVALIVGVNEMLNSQKEILNFGKFNGEEEIKVVVPVRYSIFGKPEYMTDSEKTLCSMAVSAADNQGYEEAAITRIYAFLLEKGNFKNAKKAAASCGHSKELIEKTYSRTVQKIKDSPYKEVIEKLNDIDIDKM